jgi:hypothetical protein
MLHGSRDAALILLGPILSVCAQMVIAIAMERTGFAETALINMALQLHDRARGPWHGFLWSNELLNLRHPAGPPLCAASLFWPSSCT